MGLWAAACQPPAPYAEPDDEGSGASLPWGASTSSSGTSSGTGTGSTTDHGLDVTSETSVGSTTGAPASTTTVGSTGEYTSTSTEASTTVGTGADEGGDVEDSSSGIEEGYEWQRIRLPLGIDGAADLSVGPDGVIWFVSTMPATPFLDEQMFRRFPGDESWHKVAGGARRIAAAPRFSAVCAQGEMAKHANFHWETGKRVWTRLPGAATDIGIGRAGQRWSCSPDCDDTGCTIHAWDLAGGQWFEESPTAIRGLRIAVDSDGWPWFVDAAGDVYHWDGEIERRLGPEGCATAIGVGGAEAQEQVWVIAHESCAERAGDGALWSWQRPLGDLSTPMWHRLDEVEAYGREITVEDSGQPWVSRADGGLWRRVLLP